MGQVFPAHGRGWLVEDQHSQARRARGSRDFDHLALCDRKRAN